MRTILKSFTLACFFSCMVTASFSQEKTTPSISFRIGAGSNIATQHFFTNDVAFNVPTTSFVHFGLFTNILERNNRSLFLCLELQALNYYPAPTVKSNLAFIPLLVGKTRKYDIHQRIYLKQTNGISLNTLAEATSSSVTTNPDFLEYTGSPFTNLNVGAFSNLQVLFTGVKKKTRSFDYGLGFDIAFKGYQIYKDKLYPSYLFRNFFLQYGINIHMSYNL